MTSKHNDVDGLSRPSSCNRNLQLVRVSTETEGGMRRKTRASACGEQVTIESRSFDKAVGSAPGHQLPKLMPTRRSANILIESRLALRAAAAWKAAALPLSYTRVGKDLAGTWKCLRHC
jgi:hypothetical protein